jgi:hypothetical protein
LIPSVGRARRAIDPSNQVSTLDFSHSLTTE